jgi:hypothetical protein
MSLRTYPICVTTTRHAPTLLGLIRQAEAELRSETPRPRPPVPPLAVRRQA